MTRSEEAHPAGKVGAASFGAENFDLLKDGENFSRFVGGSFEVGDDREQALELCWLAPNLLSS